MTTQPAQTPRFFTGNIAAFVRRHRVATLLTWLVICVVTIGSCVVVGANEDLADTGRGDSAAAAALIDDRFGGGDESAGSETIVFRHPTLTVDDEEYSQTVAALLADLRDLRAKHVRVIGDTERISYLRVFTSTFSHYDIGVPRESSPLVSVNSGRGDVTFASADYAAGAVGLVDIAELKALVAAAGANSDFEILIGGGDTTNEEVEALLDEGFGFVSLAGTLGSILLLLLAMGGLVAAGIPVIIAYLGVLMSAGIVTLLSNVTPMDPVWLQIVLLMGLAAGIDYALFLFTRFRFERERGVEPEEAAAIASHTAGKGVFIAALTTMLAINGMFLISNATFTSLGIAAIVTIFMSLLIATTLMPALLSDRLSWLTVPWIGGRFNVAQAGVLNPLAGMLVRAATRWRFVVGPLSFIAMLALAWPMLSLNLGFNGARALHDDVESKRAILALEEEFTIGLLAPALVVVDPGAGSNVFAAGVQAQVDTFIANVEAANEDAEAAGEHVPFAPPFQTDVNDAGDAEIIQIPVNADTGEAAALDAIRLLREEIVPASFSDGSTNVLVTGQTAGNLDFQEGITARTPLVIIFVVLTAYIVLVALYRSVVIPLIAVVLNLLAVGAAYGVLVLVFQDGRALESILDFEATGIVEAWLPLFVFSIMFGISMDYLTFAIGRVQELYQRGSTTEEAIIEGVQEGFGIVFSAAAIMIAVAAAFAFTKFFALQQFGFALALAVAFDTTLILLVLLPAMLRLAHDRLWYMPAWLEWLPGGPPDFPEPMDPSRP